MATSTLKWETLPGLTTYLTTELNALASAGLKTGAAITAGNEMWMRVALDLAVQGSARSAGAYVGIYVLTSIDGGTKYDYGSDSLAGPANRLRLVLPLDAAVTARYVTGEVLIPASTHVKLLLLNATGQAFAASGTILSYAFVSEIAE